MKRLLFVDRDGTIIEEPKDNFQVDELSKFTFIKNAISSLKKIVDQHEYELVLITNQDGLGSSSFPREKFEALQSLMLRILESEGIRFKDILIDESFAEWNLSTRKPGTGLLQPYMSGDYDLKSSYVIGDRLTDMQLAKAIGAKGILLGQGESSDYQVATSWHEVLSFLKNQDRSVTLTRKTNETDIKLSIKLDSGMEPSVNTGQAFLDHMLIQIGKHANLGLKIQAKGDLHVDEHHLVEDCAILLGEAINSALGKKKGIERYGFVLPMDEALSTISLDLSGRSHMEWDVKLESESIGGVNKQLFKHFFLSLASSLKASIHIQAKGENDHHIVESIFKSFGRALRQAVVRSDSGVPSSKGIL